MTARASALGISMDFGGNVGNSLDSLRLLAWAGDTSNLQEALAQKLGEGHFTAKQCVGDRDVLIRAATAVGLPGREAAKVLEDSGAYRDAVNADIEELRSHGVHSIPVTIFKSPNGTSYEICGARSVGEYREILRKVVNAA